MNCKVLVDAARVARWKVGCIDMLRRDHTVAVCEVAPARPRKASSIGKLIGGSALHSIEIETVPFERGNCDVVVDLRSGVVPDPSAFDDAAYWFFCESDGDTLGELPGIRAIAAGSPTFTIDLVRRDRSGRTETLRTGRFKSLYAYSRSLQIAMGECKRWPSIALDVLGASGRISGTPRALPRRGVPRPDLLTLAFRLAASFIAHAYRHLFLDARWNVGLINGSPRNFLSTDYRPQVEWLNGRTSEFLADPFVFAEAERRYVLGERVDRNTRNGFITCLEVGGDSKVLRERAVIRSETHLSYPYVFMHEGTWYMVPESAEENCIVLYRAVDVPYRWERVQTLISNVATCDNTIVRYDGRWWLFCTEKTRDANLNLFLYHAPDLLGPWKPHVANPVKTDICSSRPAGTPFLLPDGLYRPAQDCARAYGEAIAFNRITAMTEHEYREEIVSTFGRRERNQGVHTLSYADGVMAIDARTDVFASPAVIKQRLRKLATRIASYAS